jgi:hypothetical protein
MAVIGVAFYCYQTIILLLADQSCSKPPPISAWTMTTVLQIAVEQVVKVTLIAVQKSLPHVHTMSPLPTFFLIVQGHCNQ